MKRLSTAALTVALMTGVSGIALAATDVAPSQGGPVAAVTSAPVTPAMPATKNKMVKSQPEATKAETTRPMSMKAEAKKATEAQPSEKPIHHVAIIHRRDTKGERDTMALNMLEAHGYGQIVQFRQDGSSYDATVMQHGKELQVTVNPDTGKILQRA